MKLKLILTTAIVGAALALPGSAWAQAPPNDTFEQATVISSLPFSQTLDTSEATTDSTDAEALAACGLSVPLAATVWYEYTPPADQSLAISTSGSSYIAGVAVLTGSPGSLSAVTCFPALGASRRQRADLPHRGGRHRRGQRRHAEPFRPDAGGRTQRRSLRPVRPQDGGRNCHRHAHMPEWVHGHRFRDPVPAHHDRELDEIPSTSPATARPSRGRSHSRRLTASSRAAPPTCRRTPSSAFPSAASPITPTEGSSCAGRTNGWSRASRCTPAARRRPSKPPGCGSRRCHRRTSRPSGQDWLSSRCLEGL